MSSNFEMMKELIAAMSGTGENTLAVNKTYLEFMGSLEGGVFLSQMIYFSDKSKRKDGFFYKTYDEWKIHTYLSEYNIRKQVKILVEMNVLETKVMRANGNPTVHYKFNMDAFIPLFITFLKNRRNENENFNDVPSISQFPTFEKEDSITKITTEITTKNYEEDRPQLQFNLFDEIKMITGKMPSAIQTEEIMRWINALPTEVLQEAVKRTKEATPDNPFRYLKAIISHWQAKGLRTLEAVMQDDIKRQGGNKNAINQGQQLHANDDEQRKLQEKLARIEKIKGHRANNEADF